MTQPWQGGPPWKLAPVAGKERRAKCGCLLFEQAERTISNGCFLVGRARGLEPCPDESHLSLMNEAVTAADDPDDFDEIIDLFDAMVAART